MQEAELTANLSFAQFAQGAKVLSTTGRRWQESFIMQMLWWCKRNWKVFVSSSPDNWCFNNSNCFFIGVRCADGTRNLRSVKLTPQLFANIKLIRMFRSKTNQPYIINVILLLVIISWRNARIDNTRNYERYEICRALFFICDRVFNVIRFNFNPIRIKSGKRIGFISS